MTMAAIISLPRACNWSGELIRAKRFMHSVRIRKRQTRPCESLGLRTLNRTVSVGTGACAFLRALLGEASARVILVCAFMLRERVFLSSIPFRRHRGVTTPALAMPERILERLCSAAIYAENRDTAGVEKPHRYPVRGDQSEVEKPVLYRLARDCEISHPKSRPRPATGATCAATAMDVRPWNKRALMHDGANADGLACESGSGRVRIQEQQRRRQGRSGSRSAPSDGAAGQNTMACFAGIGRHHHRCVRSGGGSRVCSLG